MLALEKMSIGRAILALLSLFWFIGLMIFSFAPIPKHSIQLDLPLNISNQTYWMNASDQILSGRPSYVMHHNTSPEFVLSASNETALCRHDSVHNNLDCGWMEDTIFHRAQINLDRLLPTTAIYYTWLGNGTEYQASRMAPFIAYIMVSFFAMIIIWVFRP